MKTVLVWMGGVLIGIVAFFLFIVVFVVGDAFGHSWYESQCCHDKDCAPLPDSAVSEVPGGFILTSSGEFIAQSDTRPGRDHRYHICINHLTGKRICFYRKFNGS